MSNYVTNKSGGGGLFKKGATMMFGSQKESNPVLKMSKSLIGGQSFEDISGKKGGERSAQMLFSDSQLERRGTTNATSSSLISKDHGS